MQGILNFQAPLDVPLFDRVVQALLDGQSHDIAQANQVLTEFSEHPEAWSRVDAILEMSQDDRAKVISLNILQGLINHKWQLLPPDQRESIKEYLVSLIIKLSSDYDALEANELYLKTLNLSLVQVLKQEWPHNWASFIPDIVGSSKTGESLCENNMKILQLLSEEIFDFSKDQMVSAKVQELKSSLNNEFAAIYELCEFILNEGERPSLILATLETLLKFLTWIPLGYIFQTNLMENLLFKFFPIELVRNVTLQCLIEIGSLKCADMDEQFAVMIVTFFNQLSSIVPPDTDFAAAFYEGGPEDKAFVQYLTLFLTSYFKAHLNMLEDQPNQSEVVVEGHMLLAQLSLVPSEDIFKICIEYWNQLASSLYVEGEYKKSVGARRRLYAPVLTNVRIVMIQRMAKPEEVLIVEDETGNVVQVKTKDTAAMALYKMMRDTLIFLTNIDPEDTRLIMENKLRLVIGAEWSWQNLNSLCWAIGSISGALKEHTEKDFLVTVIKALLDLCSMKRGKDNKAVIASDIMYIVGQYPRFLRAHWRFLRTVVKKLFEFMHEEHPGVKDMACETFLKIAQKCKRKFTMVQQMEQQPYVVDILEDMRNITDELEPNQVQVFYEAVGFMIGTEHDQEFRDRLIEGLYEWPNQWWMSVMEQASQDVQILQDINTIKAICNIIRTNNRGAMSLSHSYVSQLSKIYMDLLNVYKAYSEMINRLVQQYGENATHRVEVRYMRMVKQETLTLVQTFVERNEDPELVVNDFLPPLFEAVLEDYTNSIPGARDAEVLSVINAIVEKLQENVTSAVPAILDAVFECTLDMVKEDFDSFMDIRTNFFTLLRTISQHCFPAFFDVPGDVFKLIVSTMIWAMKHNKPELAELGLNAILELLQKVSQGGSDLATAFYSEFYLTLLNDVFVVLTDTLHKAGFRLQAALLQALFHLCETGQVVDPLFDTSQFPNHSNQQYMREYTVDLLADAFQNLRRDEIEQFVLRMFSLHDDLPKFKTHMRDFLISLKSFSAQDNTDLYLEEKEMERREQERELAEQGKQLPGLIGPYHPLNSNEDML